VLNLSLWTTRELKILLSAQEYPEGTMAQELERVIAERGGR
jgi:hypothetical protein